MKKFFCQNCGLNNHKKRDCPLPIISIGIVCAQLDKTIKLKEPIDYVKIDRINSNNMKSLEYLNTYKNKIKFLMIRRKHTINYVEFIRGKYQLNIIELTELFRSMSPDEIINVSCSNFKQLWENMWKETSWRKSFEKEYTSAQNNFEKFKEFNNGKLFKYLTNDFVPDYNEPEWGFPKGRRNYKEANLTCALREFSEETGLDNTLVKILDNVSPVNEEYLGTNNKKYCHILYVGTITKLNVEFDIKDNLEVGDIGWFTLDEIFNLLRDYHEERRKVIEKIFLFLINLII